MRVALRLTTVTLTGLLLVSVAGCGGGAPSRSRFARDAGRICREANERFARVDVVGPDAAGADAALGDIVEIGGLAIRDLRRVKPPNRDQSGVEAWLGALEQALDEVTYARMLVLDDEIVGALAAIARADILTRRARELARAVGVARVCAVPELLPGD